MKVFFSNYDFPGMLAGVRARGHEVVSNGQWGWDPKDCPDNWWVHMQRGSSPAQWGAYLSARTAETGADVLVLGKGYHWVDGVPWYTPPAALEQIRRRGTRIVYLSWDDPDHVDAACKTGMLQWVDAIGTCCLDVRRSKGPYRARAPRARIFDFWPGWDQASWEPLMAEPVTPTCDLLLGGTPYLKPTDEYAGPPRRDIAWAAIRHGWKVEVWGPPSWLNLEHGGDPALAPYYHGEYAYAERGRLWRRARVNVNVHIRYGAPLYLNDRFFMVGGCGQPLVCDDQPGVAEHFPEVYYYRGGDLAQLMDRAALILSDPAPAAARATVTRERILAKHTLAHRVDAMLAALA